MKEEIKKILNNGDDVFDNTIKEPPLETDQWLRVCALRIATTTYPPDEQIPCFCLLKRSETIFEFLKTGKLPEDSLDNVVKFVDK